MTESERFGLVFVKTGSINSGTGLGGESRDGGCVPSPWYIRWRAGRQWGKRKQKERKTRDVITEGRGGNLGTNEAKG
jgi:hypothetical protein